MTLNSSISSEKRWDTTVLSHIDTTFTHAAALVTAVLYACIGARLRFIWALTCALITFGAFVVLVTGTTPLQAIIVAANAKLMALSYVFGLLVNYAFEHSERRNWLLRRLEQQQSAALKEASENLRRLSTQDPLTGLFNRRQFEVDLDSAWVTAALANGFVSMLMLDVDFFKRYNDTYGHPAGDACLIRVSKAIAQAAQLHDGIAARLGGEEFGMLLPGRTLDEAVAIGATIQAGITNATSASPVAPLALFQFAVNPLLVTTVAALGQVVIRRCLIDWTASGRPAGLNNIFRIVRNTNTEFPVREIRIEENLCYFGPSKSFPIQVMAKGPGFEGPVGVRSPRPRPPSSAHW